MELVACGLAMCQTSCGDGSIGPATAADPRRVAPGCGDIISGVADAASAAGHRLGLPEPNFNSVLTNWRLMPESALPGGVFPRGVAGALAAAEPAAVLPGLNSELIQALLLGDPATVP